MFHIYEAFSLGDLLKTQAGRFRVGYLAPYWLCIMGRLVLWQLVGKDAIDVKNVKSNIRPDSLS